MQNVVLFPVTMLERCYIVSRINAVEPQLSYLVSSCKENGYSSPFLFIARIGMEIKCNGGVSRSQLAHEKSITRPATTDIVIKSGKYII